jgi:8-oxo-dGTP diphosphatase
MGELRRLVGKRPLFSIGVSIVLLDEQGRWLLQRRSDSGLWGLPGGGVEPGETFEQAAARELYEETGLTGVALTRMGSVSGPEMRHVYPHGDEVYLVGMAFRGSLSAAKFAEATLGTDGETLELAFFDLNALPTLNDNIERYFARCLRAEANLPDLPELGFTSVLNPPGGEYLAELRVAVGPRPLFAPGTSMVIYDDQGRMLLLKDLQTGLWKLPGGYMQLGETLEQCAHRKLYEETGLRAGHLEELYFYAGAEYRFTYPNGDVIDNVAMLYRVHGVSGELMLGNLVDQPNVDQPQEVLAYSWFAPDQLPAPEELSGPLTLAMLRFASSLSIDRCHAPGYALW